MSLTTCDACGLERGASVGCTVDSLQIDGRGYPRVRHGFEYWRGEYRATETPCDDCGVGVGQLHHAVCEAEECPACHSQAVWENWEEDTGPDEVEIRFRESFEHRPRP